MNQFNWDTSFSVDFDLESGISKKAETTKRYLSQMKDMYYDTDSAERILEESDPLIYEFHELGCPERSGDLAFGTTILYPGCVGDEYYMTKGHFHTILETAEVYYTLSGEGYMVMENPEGDTLELPLRSMCQGVTLTGLSTQEISRWLCSIRLVRMRDTTMARSRQRDITS